MNSHRESRTAPFYSIPPRRLVSVEHPALIKNIDKAVATLQGNAGIEKILNPHKADIPAKLVLRPDDILARSLHSTSCPSNNVLLRVAVPKRTGRKRKRGSDDPFMDAEPEEASEHPRRWRAKDMFRSLRDNHSKYTVDTVGRVERTHFFRGLPDFVYSTTNSDFTKRFRECVVPYELEKLKQFDIDMGKGALTDVDIIPPPSFSIQEVPFPYMYRQNPTVRQAVDQTGEITTVNLSQPTKIRSHLVAYDIPKVPSTPQEGLAPIDALDNGLRELINHIKQLFEQRPAWTRRALRNQLVTDEQRTLLRHAIPYVGYIFRSGPWRDAIIKLGLDPRSSPEYRHYQTIMFRILPREVELARENRGGRRHNIPRHEEESDFTSSSGSTGKQNTHIFTGQLPLPRDGRIWMVCDIKDPLLESILNPPNATSKFLRPKCETIQDGWFGNGTLAKLKTIMRTKIQTLIDDRLPSDQDFACIMPFPDHASTESDLVQFTLDPTVASNREIALATDVRAGIKGAPLWRQKNERERYGMEKVGRSGRGGPRQRGKAALRAGHENLAGEDEEEEEGGKVNEEQSEGEEEEMERAEMLEAQVTAAITASDAARDAEDEDAGRNGAGENDDNEGEDEGEDEESDATA